MSQFVRWCLVLLSIFATSSAQGIETNLGFGAPPSFARSILFDIPKVPEPFRHNHPDNIEGLAAAEADRLGAMLAVIECNTELAEELFVYAYRHDPSNEATLAALVRAKYFFFEEGIRRTKKARESEEYALKLEQSPNKELLFLLQINDTKFMYRDALECDPNNPIARAGYTRVWMLQHGSWTLSKKLGY